MPMRQHLFGGMLAAAALAAPDVAQAAALDGAALRWPWALPFIGILVTIATGPLLFPKIWHNHYGKLAFIWGTLTVAPLAGFVNDRVSWLGGGGGGGFCMPSYPPGTFGVDTPGRSPQGFAVS